MLPDRFFDDIFDIEPRGKSDKMECDIYEEDGNYVVEANVTGFNKDDIKVETEDGSIIITASKEENNQEEDKNKKYLRRERHFKAKTQRAFYLGDIDEENIKANFNNGVLKVVVPKKEIESNKKIIDID